MVCKTSYTGSSPVRASIFSSSANPFVFNVVFKIQHRLPLQPFAPFKST